MGVVGTIPADPGEYNTAFGFSVNQISNLPNCFAGDGQTECAWLLGSSNSFHSIAGGVAVFRDGDCERAADAMCGTESTLRRTRREQISTHFKLPLVRLLHLARREHISANHSAFAVRSFAIFDHLFAVSRAGIGHDMQSFCSLSLVLRSCLSQSFIFAHSAGVYELHA